jgi:peptidyl-tRNA hydrolase, PTH1 family
MIIIVGLGNPEASYAGTRHNIGFEIVDKLREDFFAQGGPASGWEFNKKFNAEISKGNLEGREILLVRPWTFVNLSGTAIAKILEFYKLTADDVIVIHDDLDIALGKYKIATDSSSAGHNGVQNIIETLGTQKFKRVRIGIGEEVSGVIACRIDAHDYVLGKFSEEELEKLKKISDDILSAVKSLV